MKVKDLILVLSTYDPELDVVMAAGEEGTAHDIDVPARAHIFRNQSADWWRGKHDFVPFWSNEGGGDEVVAIVPLPHTHSNPSRDSQNAEDDRPK